MPQLIDKSKWAPDNAYSFCGLCAKKFTLFTRRHHCRSCGKVFCADCTQHRLPCHSNSSSACGTTDDRRGSKKRGEEELHRVCNQCACSLLRLSDDLLKYITLFLPSLDVLLGSCRRCMLLVPLPFRSLKELQNRFEYLNPQDVFHVSDTSMYIRCLDRTCGKERVLKLIRKDTVYSQRQWQKVHQEIDCLHTISHPAFPHLYDVVQTRRYLVLVQESFFANQHRGLDSSSRSPAIYDDRRFVPLQDCASACVKNAKDIVTITRHVLEALMYLHRSAYIVHGAVSPRTVLVDPSTLKVKLVGLRHAMVFADIANPLQSAFSSFSGGGHASSSQTRSNASRRARHSLGRSLTQIHQQVVGTLSLEEVIEQERRLEEAVDEEREPEVDRETKREQHEYNTDPGSSPTSLQKKKKPPRINVERPNIDRAIKKKSEFYRRQAEGRDKTLSDAMADTRSRDFTMPLSFHSKTERAKDPDAGDVMLVPRGLAAYRREQLPFVAPELLAIEFAVSIIPPYSLTYRQVEGVDVYAVGAIVSWLLPLLGRKAGGSSSKVAEVATRNSRLFILLEQLAASMQVPQIVSRPSADQCLTHEVFQRRKDGLRSAGSPGWSDSGTNFSSRRSEEDGRSNYEKFCDSQKIMATRRRHPPERSFIDPTGGDEDGTLQYSPPAVQRRSLRPEPQDRFR